MRKSIYQRSRIVSTRAPRFSGIEVLESRIAPAVTASVNAGVLTVTESAAGDHVTLSAPSSGMVQIAGTGFTTQSFSGVTSITVNANAANDQATVQFGAFDPIGGHPFTFTGTSTGAQLLIAGSGAESVVWSPSGAASNTGSIAVNGADILGYSGALGGLNFSAVAALKLLGSAGIQSYTLDSAAGAATLSGVSAGFSHSASFSAIPSVTVDLGTNEMAANSNVFAVNSLSGESALQNLSIVTGAGNDQLNLNVTSLLLPTSGGAFSWVGGGGSTGDLLTATASASMTLSNGALSFAGGGALSFPSLDIALANLVDTGGGHTFNVDGWTKGGKLTNSSAGVDTVSAAKNADFSIGDLGLQTSDGMNISLSKIGVADLTGTMGSHSFNVSGWSGTGILNGQGGASDTLQDLEGANFTLADGSLGRAGKPALMLVSIEVALLTDNSTAGGHSFDVSDWTGTGTLTENGTAAGVLIAAKSGSFTLSDSSISDTADQLDLMLAGSTGFASAKLTDSAGGGHTFTVSEWTGGGSLTSQGGSDTVISSKHGGAVLSDHHLQTDDGLNMDLFGIDAATLTDTNGGAHIFDVSAWTSNVSITSLGGSDTIAATKSANFTLANLSLTADDGLNATLSGIGTANLTDSAGGSHTFDVSAWTQGGSLISLAGSDAVLAAKDGNFTLADGSLQAADGLAMDLMGIGVATLTDAAGGAHTFTVSGWTGAGSLTSQNGADALISSKTGGATLSNDELVTDDHLDLALSGIAAAALTDVAGGAHTFDVSAWTGHGSLTSAGGSDTVKSMKGGGAILGNGSLSTDDGMSLNLSGIGTANLTDTNGGANTFDVSGWTGHGSLTSQGGPDTVKAMKNGGAILSDGALSTDDGMSLDLAGIGAANLTDTNGGAHGFDVSGWTGAGSAASQGGSDSLTAHVLSKGADLSLQEALTSPSTLISSDGLNITFAGISKMDLNGTQIALQGNAGGSETAVWEPSGVAANTGAITLHLAALTVDYVVAGANDLSISTLAGLIAAPAAGNNSYLLGAGPSAGLGEISGTSGGFVESLIYSIAAAVTVDHSVHGTAADTNTLTVDAFAGTGLMNVAFKTGLGDNTLVLDSNLQSLLPAAGGSFQWTAGSGGNTLQASVDEAGFSVTQMKLANGGLSYFDANNQPLGQLGLTGVVQTAILTGAPVTGSQTFLFDVSGWTHNGAGSLLTGEGPIANNKLVSTKDVAYQKLSDNAGDTVGTYAATDGLSLSLANIGQAQLAGGNGAGGTFTVSDLYGASSKAGNWIDASGFHGTATLIGGDSIADTLGHNVGYDIFSVGLGTNFIYAGSQDSRFELNNSAKLTILYSSDTIGFGAKKAGQNHNLLDFASAMGGVHVNLADFTSYTSGDEALPSLSIKAQDLANGTIVTETIAAAESTVSADPILVLVGVYDDLQGSHYADVLTGNKYKNIIYGNGEMLKGTHDVLGGGGGLNALIGDARTTFKAAVGVDARGRYGKLIDSFVDYLPYKQKASGQRVLTTPFSEPLPPVAGLSPALLLAPPVFLTDSALSVGNFGAEDALSVEFFVIDPAT